MNSQKVSFDMPMPLFYAVTKAATDTISAGEQCRRILRDFFCKPPVESKFNPDDAVSTRILTVIKGHNKFTPIQGPSIVREAGLRSDVELRKYINSLRGKEYPICSSPDGYWWAMDKQDIDQTCRDLEGRIAGIMHAINGLKRCANNL